MTIWPKIPTAPTSKRHRLNLAKCGTINHFFNNESDVLATVDGNHTRFLGIAMYYPSRAGSHLHYQLIFVIVFCVVNGLTGIGDILNRNCQLSTYDSSFSGTLFNLLNNFGLSDLLLHLISCWAHRCTTGGQTLKALYCQPGLRPFYERNGFVVRFDERDTNNVNFHHLSGFIWNITTAVGSSMDILCYESCEQIDCTPPCYCWRDHWLEVSNVCHCLSTQQSFKWRFIVNKTQYKGYDWSRWSVDDISSKCFWLHWY